MREYRVTIKYSRTVVERIEVDSFEEAMAEASNIAILDEKVDESIDFVDVR